MLQDDIPLPLPYPHTLTKYASQTKRQTVQIAIQSLLQDTEC